VRCRRVRADGTIRQVVLRASSAVGCRGVPGPVSRLGGQAVARPRAPAVVPGARLRLRRDGPAAMPRARARLAACGQPRGGFLARGRRAGRPAGGRWRLPDRVLRPVGASRGRAVLCAPPPLEAAGMPGPGGIRPLMRDARRRARAGRPEAAAAAAAAGAAVRPAVPARRQYDQDPPVGGPVRGAAAHRQRRHLVAGPGRAGMAGLVRARDQPARDRAGDLRSPQGDHAGRRAGLGERVPPRHLAAAPPGHRLRARCPPVHRDQPAVAERPRQAVDPVAAQRRPQRRRLLPGRAGSHPVRRVPRSGRHPGSRPGQPRGPGTLPGRPANRAGRQEGPPVQHRAAEHVPAGSPPA